VIEEVPVEKVDDFCYWGSMMSSNSSYDKEIKTLLGKADAVFGRLERIWKAIVVAWTQRLGYTSS